MVAAYEDNVPFLASALTFNALLALIPFALLFLSALGYIIQADGQDGRVVDEVSSLFAQLLPRHAPVAEDPFGRAEEFFVRVVESRAQLSAYGVPLFLWFSTQFFGAVRAALNEVFDTKGGRGCLAGIGWDLLLVLITVVLFSANTVVSIPTIGIPGVARWLSDLTAMAFGVLLFFAIYILAPSRPIRWKTALLAATFASVAFELAKRGYGVYLAHFATIDRVISNTNAIAILLLILWMFFTAVVFLVGGEVAQAYDVEQRQRAQRAILT